MVIARPTILRSATLITVSEEDLAYSIEQTFSNENDIPVEGAWIYPLSREAAAEIAVNVDGIPAAFELREPAALFPLLRESAISARDPALLEIADQRAIVIPKVHLGERQQWSIRLTYRAPLPERPDALKITAALTGEKYSAASPKDLDVRVRFKTNRPVRSIFSPTHTVEIIREAPHRAMVVMRPFSGPIRSDFSLFATFSSYFLDVAFFQGTGEESRAYLSVISPPVDSQIQKSGAKDVVFVADISSAMSDEERRAAQKALTWGIERFLRPQDTFNVIAVGTSSTLFSEKLETAVHPTIAEAAQFIDAIEPAAGPDLYNGIINGLEQFTAVKKNRLLVIIGDGRALVGVTKPQTIEEDVKRFNRRGVAIFGLAVGEKANVALLDRLSGVSKGTSTRLSVKDNFSATVAKFFSALSAPVVSNVVMDFPGMRFEPIHPEPAQDIFGSESLTLVGEYEGSPEKPPRVTVRAKSQGRVKTITRIPDMSDPVHQQPFVGELPAMRRMAGLLEREWLKPGQWQVRNEISALSAEHGFSVPSSILAPPQSPSSSHEPATIGMLLSLYKNSMRIEDVLAEGYRIVDGRTFRYDDGLWIDMRLNASEPAHALRFLSPEYFAFVEAHPHVGRYFALGSDVRFRFKAMVIQVKSPD